MSTCRRRLALTTSNVTDEIFVFILFIYFTYTPHSRLRTYSGVIGGLQGVVLTTTNISMHDCMYVGIVKVLIYNP